MNLKLFFSRLTVLSFCLVVLATCSDDVSEGPSNPEEPGNKPNFEAKVTTSVNGFVTNEKNEPFAGVKVTAGDKSVQTDGNGYFEILNTSLTQDISFLTAESEGYFRGIRTWRGDTGQKDFVRVKLLPKTIIGTITSGSGGEVATADGVKLSFPANGIVNADGSAYTGSVNVAAQWLDPSTEDIHSEMPGDLRAINSEENMVGLVTYGMVAVELTSPAGELLQVAPSKKVEMRAPIPASFQPTAPQDMPLWYFDETKGVWMEEGSSKRVGNEYVGEVGHFSFWNFDVPRGVVAFSGKVTDSSGNSVSHVKVKVAARCMSNGVAYVYSDENGIIRGVVPISCTIVLYIYGSDEDCPVVSYEFKTGNSAIDQVSLIIPEAKEQKVSGKLLTCDYKPVTDGYIIYSYDGLEKKYAKLTDGKYEFTILTCKQSNTEVEITGYNKDEKKQAVLNVSVPRSTDAFVVPDIHACDAYSYITMLSNGQSTTIMNAPFNSGRYSYIQALIHDDLWGATGTHIEMYASEGSKSKQSNVCLNWPLSQGSNLGTFELNRIRSRYSGNGIYKGSFKSGTITLTTFEIYHQNKKATLIGTYKGIVTGYADLDENGYTIGDPIEKPVSGSFYYSDFVVPQ